MAQARPRSANAELSEGMTDGKYKKVITDRGGVVEGTTYQDRQDLADVWHGIHEAPVKVLPDGLRTSTPNFVATPPAHLD
jgi:hypothetical protein